MTTVGFQIGRNSVSSCCSVNSVPRSLLCERQSLVSEGRVLPKNRFTLITRSNVSITSFKILEPVLDATFENLIPHLAEELQRNILLEFWELVPSDVADKYCQCHARLSKEGCISAFEEAEERHRGNSEKALQKLINMKNVPLIADFTANNINNSFKGNALVTSYDERYHDMSMEHIASIGFGCSSLVSVYTPPSYSQQQSPNKPVCGIFGNTKRVAILLLTGFAIACLSIYRTLYILKHDNQNPEVSFSSLLSGNGMISGNTERPSQWKNIVKRKYEISVQSYNDYENAMNKVPIDSDVPVTLSLQSSTDWPLNASLGTAHMISKLKLEGKTNVTLVPYIVKGMNNLKYFTISNSSRLSCGDPQRLGYLNTVELAKLQQITFEGIQECSDLYQKLSHHIHMKNLRRLVTKLSIIYSRDVKHIQKILKQARASIENIELSDTTIHGQLFDSRLGRLPNVVSLQMDIMEDNRIVYVDRFIHEYLPNLKTIISTTGYLDWNQFMKLSKCKQLETITMAVRVPKPINKIDFKELHKMFPALKTVELSFVFENNSNCSVIGGLELGKLFKSLTYRDNCRVSVFDI